LYEPGLAFEYFMCAHRHKADIRAIVKTLSFLRPQLGEGLAPPSWIKKNLEVVVERRRED
jgi:hypothetical protein